MIDWDKVSQSFKADGSLRDIYIQDTSIDDWDVLLSHLKELDPLPKFQSETKFGKWPKNASVIFDRSNDFTTIMKVDVSGLVINCHFFTSEEIEFDINPKEVVGQSELNALCGFMRSIGQVVEKLVILTPENFQEKPILEFNPATDEFNFIENFEH